MQLTHAFALVVQDRESHKRLFFIVIIAINKFMPKFQY